MMENSTSMANFFSPLPNSSAPENAALCSINDFGTCWLIPVCSILTSISLTGNTATFINILCRRMYKDVTYMCILLLSLSDLMSSGVMYTTMFILYPRIYNFYFNVPLCILFFWGVFTPFMWRSGNLVVMAYERYSLILNPIKYHTYHSSRRVLKLSLTILAVMSTLSISYAVILSFIKVCPDFLLVTSYFAYIGVPLVFSIFGMLLYLHCSKLRKMKTLSTISLNLIYRRRCFEMTTKVYLICFAYVFGQLPFVINDIVIVLVEYQVLDSYKELMNILYQIGTVTMLANYAFNPFIYFLSFDRLASFCRSKDYSNRSSFKMSDLETPNSKAQYM